MRVAVTFNEEIGEYEFHWMGDPDTWAAVTEDFAKTDGGSASAELKKDIDTVNMHLREAYQGVASIRANYHVGPTVSGKLDELSSGIVKTMDRYERVVTIPSAVTVGLAAGTRVLCFKDHSDRVDLLDHLGRTAARMSAEEAQVLKALVGKMSPHKEVQQISAKHELVQVQCMFMTAVEATVYAEGHVKNHIAREVVRADKEANAN